MKAILITEINNVYPICSDENTGLEITNYHPIIVNKEWKFPIECENIIKNIQFFLNYIVLLSKKNIYAMINETQVICLRHNMNGFVQHPYYGTNKILDDIKNFGNNGILTLSCAIFERENGVVIGIKNLDVEI